MSKEFFNGFNCYVQGREAYDDSKPRVCRWAPASPQAISWFKGWDDGEHATKNGLVHVAEAATDRVQHCVICGCVLTDNRNGMYAIIEGQPPPTDSYWPEGPVTVVKNGIRTDFTAGVMPRVPQCSYEIGGL